MNKQEAIKHIEQMGEYERFVDELVSKKSVLNIISQIDQLQEVVIPKFVAEWIEYCKSNSFSLMLAFEHWALSDKIRIWLIKSNNQKTFARAYLDGYEVEKEKMYEVIIPHTNNYKNQKQYLVKQGKNWFFCGNDVNRFKYQFTKGQIEAAGFGWVFDCNGMKVEEVE